MNWWQLRAAGNLYVLKISYAALVLIPLLSNHQELASRLDLAPWLMAVLFTASFTLALANLIYDVGCPTIVKRFASPNDLYDKMLDIRERTAKLYPDDAFGASIQHCKRAYEGASHSRTVLRWVCSLLFGLSAISFAIIFGYRAFVVYSMAWRSAG